ncbi:MAG: hypothetical protein IIW66_03980, partial [Bacteroidales bacterium]|nr:hypothetical protein [Bacteroidales bacterium]
NADLGTDHTAQLVRQFILKPADGDRKQDAAFLSLCKGDCRCLQGIVNGFAFGKRIVELW